jgi:ribosomal protein S18 acetylase RimI-like enzyme
MSQNTRIVPVSADALNDIARVIDACARWLITTKGMFHWMAYYTLNTIREKFDHGQYFVVYTDEGEPLALMHCSTEPPPYLEQDDFKLCAEPDKPALYLSALAVLPTYHGQGYAKQLVAHAEKVAGQLNTSYIRLDAREDYEELLAFYKNLGYEKRGDLPDEGINYLLLEKRVE